MNVIETILPDVLIIEPKVFSDSRGFFKEIFQNERYSQNGIELNFVQDNYSRSKKDVLRGLHFQKSKPQGKLVTCLRGAVFDVAIDLNPNSVTFGEYIGVELSEDNHRQLWVPKGYGHGFCVLTDVADFYYKCTDFYDPTDEAGIIWNDPDIDIKWPIEHPLLTDKDLNLPNLKVIKDKL